MNRIYAIFAAFLLSTCFQPWPLKGYYRCGEDSSCPTNFVCDDGVCCKPDADPVCRSLVLPDGSCANGSTPKVYYQDADKDGFGIPSVSKLYCADPVHDKFATNKDDCDDTTALARPNGTEVCDGYDNNCDGTRDEGFSPQLMFYKDQDLDGYGDKNQSVTACAAPAGYVENKDDCAPLDRNKSPMSFELCNGEDDNCNNLVDESAAGTGASCAISNAVGVCAQGQTRCISAQLACVAPGPSSDVCDGKDNDCDTVTDERPDCDGPIDLTSGLTYGAAKLPASTTTQQLLSGCLKNLLGNVPVTGTATSWTSNGYTYQVWWAEAPDTAVFDLSRSGVLFRLKMSAVMTNPGTPAWEQLIKQPVLYFCDENGNFIRYVATSNLLQAPNFSIDETFSVAGAGGNFIIGNQSGADLKHIKRIEVLLKIATPAVAPPVPPTFTVTFASETGFSKL